MYTCIKAPFPRRSVHLRENEAVVAAVLPAAREAGFELADPFPAWHRRGVPGAVEGADKLVRTGERRCVWAALRACRWRGRRTFAA